MGMLIVVGDYMKTSEIRNSQNYRSSRLFLQSQVVARPVKAMPET
jgi:hypothetical protein